MIKLQILSIILTFSGTLSEIINVTRLPEKQLFLSKRVVTEIQEFDGGILVDENGKIEAILTRQSVNIILSSDPMNYQIVDGGKLALMAGVVDSHVHVNEPGRTSWEGYVTATQAAAAGGVTTIIDMPLNSIPPTTTLNNLKTKASVAKEEVFVDVGFWGGVIPGNEIELRDMIKAGVVGFKAFLIDSGVPEFPNINNDQLKKVFAVLNGTGTVLAFHAETDVGISTKCNNSKNSSCPDPVLYHTYLQSRPDEMELEAVSSIASTLTNTDVHVHIVHVSAEGVVPVLEKARAERLAAGHRGWRGGITAETCHHYLTLSAEEVPPGHSEFKCSPPIRNLTNKEKLWEYIRDERLDLVTSDHSPSIEGLKGENFMTAWGGISSVQFDLPLFWTQAKARGFSLSTVSHYLSAGPARLCGLQERKGSIRLGLDADLVFFDPNASFIITPQKIRYKNKISPYMNRVLTGKVMATYVRGQLVYADEQIIGRPKGKLLLNYGELLSRFPRGPTDMHNN
ncbi:allantoinase-like isoform X2 [Plodia interpunctella]|uniref:allantoinase-like isoform X2 n=1 Tax=Plodia interpunctella TaxID=58824 RepID=UPI0023676641|nr:allantoinase-like isoform X2 [Plodia interpunctella]